MDFRNKFSGMDFSRNCKIAVGALAILFFTGCAPTLSGVVSTSTDLLINPDEARINVTTIGTSKTKSYVVPIEADGSFMLDSGLKKGRYVVEALVPGYKISTQEVLLEGSKKINLKLISLPLSRTKTIGINIEADAGRGTGGATLMPPKL